MPRFFIVILFSTALIAQSAKFIQGSIIDTENNPVAGAQIVVLPDSTMSFSTSTGSFRFVAPATMALHLRITHTAYLPLDTILSPPFAQRNILPLRERVYRLSGVSTTALRAEQALTPVPFRDFNRRELKSDLDVRDVPMLLSQSANAYAYSETGTGVGYSHLNIRGFTQQRMNVMINGIPQNDPESHAVFWVDLPDLLNSSDNVQIHRGVGFSTNGAAAFGATVNIRTNNLNQARGARFEMGGGSFGTRKVSAALHTGEVDGYRFYGRFTHIRADGYRYRTAAELYSWFLSGGWFNPNTSLQFNFYGGQEETQLAWNGANPAMIAADRRANDTNFDNEVDNYLQPHFELLLEHKVNRQLDLSANIFYIFGEGYFEQFKPAGEYYWAEYLLPDSLATDKFVRQWLRNHHFGGQLTARWHSPIGLTSAGLSARQYLGGHFGEITQAVGVDFAALNEALRFYENNGRKSFAALFVHQQIGLGKNLDLHVDGQLRYINYRRDQETYTIYPGASLAVTHWFFNPKLGAIWRLHENQQLFTSLAISHREPTGNDYFNADDPFAVPNTAIAPERVFNVEFGWRFAPSSNWSIESNVYYLRFVDEIIANGSVDDVGNYVFVNAENSFRSGFESSLQWDYGWLFGNLQLALSYNRISTYRETVEEYDAEFNSIGSRTTTYSDVRPALAPEIISFLAVGSRLYWRNSSWYVEPVLHWRHTGEQFLDNTENAPARVAAYDVVDMQIRLLGLRLLKADFSLQLRVNNLLNSDYWQPAFVWWKYWQNDQLSYDSRYYVGAPRNYYFGLHFAF
jgi:iron complex outermembrane receptor protein